MAASSSHRKLNCKVTLPDDGVQVHQLSRKAVASELYSVVFDNIKLMETDYFGLEYISPKSKAMEWLDKEKTILSQVTSSNHSKELSFKLKVKFYTSEPFTLEHDMTRYYFSLQIKQDLMSGRLTCSENTAVILAAHIVQLELRDFRYIANSHDYLKSIKLLPNQTDELEDQIAEHHKSLKGMGVTDAEYQMLDVARRCEMYGVVPHQCHNFEGLSVHLAVTHTGVHEIINNVKTTSYIWVKIRKLGFKRKRFLVKLFPCGKKSKADDVAEFTFQSRDAAKAFWKLSIEHHSFFKKLEVKPVRRTRLLLSRGSSFRYNGRTQTQLVEQMKQKWGQSTFDRSMSLRSFSNSASHRMGKAATFQNRQELGVMTLDRGRFAKVSDNLTVPSVSQATLESRYSGCYETSPQPQTQPSEKTPLAVSNSLTAISSLTKSSGMFDIKNSRSFLTKADGERDTTRDSIAVVEDNKVELERLVEQINSGLSSTPQAKKVEQESYRKRNVSTSSIERFLSSTAHPYKPPVEQHGTSLQVPQPTGSISAIQSQNTTHVPDTDIMPSQTQTVKCAMSNEFDTLQIQLIENAASIPLTDQDIDIAGNDKQPQTSTVTADIEVHDESVNDVLDSASQKVDDTLALFVDGCATPEQMSPQRVDEAIKSKDSSLKHESESAHTEPAHTEPAHTEPAHTEPAHTEVVVHPCPGSEDEDLVFKSGLDTSLPTYARRGRTRSRQEEMADLEGLSQLAEQVLRTNEENIVRQRSQELSELATQVLDFCSESKDTQPAHLSELGDLLAHYDVIKKQQQAFQRQRTPTNDNHLKESTDSNVDNHETTTQPLSVKATRKPLIRPALPVLPVSKERLLSWNTNTFMSRSPNAEMRTLDDRKAMADSGIDMNGSTQAANGGNARQSSSDGYSSESEDSGNTIASPSTSAVNACGSLLS